MIAAAVLMQPIGAFASNFSAKPKVELGDDGRNITVIEEFWFIDREQHRWIVPPGTEVNGASIPQPFFSLIGGPLSGKYRDASIIHDFYCEPKNRIFASDRTHDVFHQAMIASGVDPAKAFIMYQAVQRFGPQWTAEEAQCTNHIVWQEAAAATDQSILNDLVDLCVQNSAVPNYDPEKEIDTDVAIEFLISLKNEEDIEVDIAHAVDVFINKLEK
ncbi:DUF1353 domain-containing protein [uncultured Hoeflea sp.]|uniref:DUF1353 domain-containing protein n=1 Tax=uncultured Hoeflea sp. TaxID=538666 RepID=UPI00262D5FA3|nr:DUF1353 domain-containing protein [uncultured Hoeflea sp.]